MDVLPVPKTSQAKPTRGAKFVQVAGNPPAGTPGSPAKTTPGGAFTYRCDCSPGCHAATRLFRSVYGRNGSHRTPRSRVKLRRIFQESCAKSETRLKRVLRYSPA